MERGRLPRRQSIAGPNTLLSKPRGSEIDIRDFEKPSESRSQQIQSDGSATIIYSLDLFKELLCCKYNEDFQYLSVGCSNGEIQLYSADKGIYHQTLIDQEIKNSPTSVTAIQHRPVSQNYPINYCFTSTYTKGFVKCWNYNFEQCIYTIRERRQTYGLTYHPRLPKLLTYGDDLKIYLYDEESKVQERILTGSTNPKHHDGPKSRVFAACFNPRSNHELITGGWDDLVHFWDLRQPHAVRHISGLHICGEGLDINSKGTEILACCFDKDKPFQFFEYASGKLIENVQTDQYFSKLYVGKYVNGAIHSVVTGGTEPNLIRMVNREKLMNLGSIVNLPGAVISIDIGPESKKKKGAPRIGFVSGHKLFQVEF